MSKNKKNQVVKISVFITSIFVIFFSITYAFINMTVTGTKKQVITSGNLSLELDEDENNLQIENALPMYDEVGMIQKPFTFRLINTSSFNANYTVKLEEIKVGNSLSKEDVKYGLTKNGENKIDLVSTIEDGNIDEGIIEGNQTIEYSLRLWIKEDVTDIQSIQDKAIRYKVNVQANPKVEPPEKSIGKVQDLPFMEENLGESCKTYDDGVDTFLVGQCSKNYVWYSGKLWRVVLKNNETGNIKMVTDNNMTTISYNEENNTAFENSYMDQWLQQEFLPTLHDADQFLVTSSVWDTTLDSSGAPTRPNGTTTVTRKVGLLNAYEYSTTYNNSDRLATYRTGYLNNGTYWWLATSKSVSDMWRVENNGLLKFQNLASVYGVRPSVNLKSNIQITSGDGTESNPYKLTGDSKEIVNGTTLLSTSYSGEYIKFNNELYRIVVVENNLTKIIAVNKPSTLTSNLFHSDYIANFGTASIKTDLETYYQGLDEATRNMIEPNTTWYLGTVEKGTNYKASICNTVDINTDTKTCAKTTDTTTTNVGLPRYGEMFTSYITRGTKAFFWTLTPYSTSETWFLNTIGYLDNHSLRSAHGARPSMYLKQNVVIAKNNTGDGTYEHPFEIELGA